MRYVTFAATAVAFGLWSAQASAQLPILSSADQKAILCIFDSFSPEEKITVAMAEINGEQKAREAEFASMLKGDAACRQALRGDQRRIDLAESVAIEESIIDVAMSQLKADGMTVGQGGIYAAWSGLSAADQVYFLDKKAPDDEAFRARVRPALVKVGVPDKDTDIDGGMLIMECIANIAAYYRQWLKLGA